MTYQNAHAAILNSHLFEQEFYAAQASSPTGNDLLNHFLEEGWTLGLNPHPLFNSNYYLNTYPDIRAAGINPLVHFITNGASELRNPNEWFHTKFYVSSNPQVAASGLNPLTHYLKEGASLGLRPHPVFDGEYYKRRYFDYSQSGINPLSHYLEFGMSEGLFVSEEFDPRFYLPERPLNDSGLLSASLLDYLVVIPEDISDIPDSALNRLVKGRLVVGFESCLVRIPVSCRSAHILPVLAGKQGITHAIRYALFNIKDSETRMALAAL
jgi:hypothetical protein